MKIPDTFKTTVASRFYDKEISVYEIEETVDAEGWASKSGSSIVSATFFGNTRFSNLEKVQMQYGIKEQIDIAITTNYNLANDSIIGYLDRQYKIFKVLPFDSHYLLIGREWSSKSTTSISL